MKLADPYHPILFKQATYFSDLFMFDNKPPLYDKRGQRVWRKLKLARWELSSYCSMSAQGRFAQRSYAVIPRLEVLNSLTSLMVVDGHLSFRLTRQDGNPHLALATVVYSQIIGSFWLSYLDITHLRGKEYPYSISKSEMETPTFEWELFNGNNDLLETPTR